MNPVSRLISDLRERRLWPVAVALLAAIVAVPVVLTKSPAPPAPLPALGTPTASAVPALAPVSVQNLIASHQLIGKAQDPFAAQTVTTTSATSSVSTTSAASGKSSAAGNRASSATTTSTTSSTAASSGAGTPSGGSSSTPSKPLFPIAKPKPAPSGLRPTQTYRVAMAFTNSGGGLGTIDPVGRLSLLPAAAQPLLVELGVLQGGGKVLFAVPAGTVVSGPGSCIPGPVDCELLALAPGDVETVSIATSAGAQRVADFAVTAISVDGHGSVDAADLSRRDVSAAGARLLAHQNLPALALFNYDPHIGAIVDERDLIVGGS